MNIPHDTTPASNQRLQLGTTTTSTTSPVRPVSTTLEQAPITVANPNTARLNDALENATLSRPTQATTPGASLPVGTNEPNAQSSNRVVPGMDKSWAAVFNKDGQNALMLEVTKIQVEAKNERGISAEPARGTKPRGVGLTGNGGLTSSGGAQVADVTTGLPAGTLTANADGSITTPGGYTVINDGDHNWRIREPSGQEHRIWGDPHVDENNDGHDDWHFNRDASFILPDGSKIFCDTDKVGTHGGEDVTLSMQLKIQYNDSVGTMNVAQGGAGVVSTGARAYDQKTSDGQVFVLSDSHTFVDGQTLGDLYDAGGDFKADVDSSKTGTISAAARFTLDGSIERSGRNTSETRQSKIDKPTLSTMVAEVYADNRVKPQDNEEASDGTIKKERLKVQGTGGA